MYCSACGKEIAPGLAFCNYCGFKLNTEKVEAVPPGLSANYLISAIVSIFVIGFGCIVAILALMKNLGFAEPMIGLIVVISLACKMFIESVLLWLLIRSNKVIRKESGLMPANQPAGELYSAPKRALGESTLQPVPSVVDSTTRSLESVHRESKTNRI